MSLIDEIPKTFAEAVNALVAAHSESGPADLKIIWFLDPQEQTVRLLLVSDEFQETGAIRPLPLGKSAEFPFRSAAALATPDEWRRAQDGSLPLPDGWDLAAARQVRP
jgi:hypothetical protein